jgi:hypothetical protein
MTITETTTRQVFTGDGTANPLPIIIPFFENTDLIVEKELNGVTTTLVLGTDYTVTGGDGAGGTIVPTAVIPADGTQWVIVRSMPQTQEIDLENQSTILASAIEEALDRLVMLLLDTDDSSARSVKADDGEVGPTGLRMPDLATRINKILQWDGSGEITAVAPSDIDLVAVTISTLGEALIAASTVAAMRTVLNIDTGTSKGAAGTAGRIYIDTATLEIFYDNGVTWDLLSASQETVVKPNLIINGTAQINQRVTCNSGSTFPNNDFGFCLDHVLLVSDGNNATTVVQNTAAAPDGGSHCFELPCATSNKKYGLMFPIDSARAASLFSAADDKKCSVRFKYKGTGIDNIRCAVLSWQGTADELTDPVLDWIATTSDDDFTRAANWTLENTPAQINVTSNWQTHEITDIDIDTNGSNNVALVIYVSDIDAIAASDILYLADVQLNEGASLAPYTRRTFREEYDDCSRFMQKSFPYTVQPAEAGGVSGAVVFVSETDNERNLGVNVRYPMPMHKSPTMVFYSPVSANAEWRNVTDPADEGAVNTLHASDSSIFLQASATSSANNNDAIAIHYTAIAELIP